MQFPEDSKWPNEYGWDRRKRKRHWWQRVKAADWVSIIVLSLMFLWVLGVLGWPR